MYRNERTDNIVFDTFENDCINDISETLTNKDLADEEKVKKLTFEKLGIKEKKFEKPIIHTKKTIKTKRRVLMIAAAVILITAVIGTAAVGASDTFTSSFSEYIAGEPADGVFSGGNVQKSSDTLDIDFHGVTGDEHTAAVSMTFTRKDGMPFIEENLVKDKDSLIVEVFSEYRPFDDDCYTEESGWYEGYSYLTYYEQKYNCTVPATHSIENFMRHVKDNDGMTANEYTFEDSRTIKYFAEYSNNAVNIKGQRLTLGLEKLYVSHIDKVLYSMDDFTDYLQWEKFRSDKKTYENLKKEYEGKLGEGQEIRIDPDWKRIVIATKYEVPLNYSVSVSLNYRTVLRELAEKNNKTLHLENGDYSIVSLKAGAYGMKLKTKAELNVFDNEKKDPVDMLPLDDLIITLDDGKTVTASTVSGSGGSIDEKYGQFETEYRYYEKSRFENGEAIRYTLDPEKIISVKVADHEDIVLF